MVALGIHLPRLLEQNEPGDDVSGAQLGKDRPLQEVRHLPENDERPLSGHRQSMDRKRNVGVVNSLQRKKRIFLVEAKKEKKIGGLVRSKEFMDDGEF